MDENQRPDEPTEPPSLAQFASALAKDAALLIEAETAFWRKAVAYALAQTKTIAMLIVLALFLAFFTLMALVVGLLLARAPLIGTWAAMGAVAAGLALFAIVSARIALRRVRRMVRLLTGTGGGDRT